jgi:hypothetical protein
VADASTFAAPSGPSTTVNTTLNSNISSDHSSIGSSDKIGDLLYTYEDEAKRPYVADYLEVANIWDKEPVLKSEISLLESYLRKMVVDKKIDNSTESAKKYLEHLEKKAGIESYESTTAKIAKLLKYINFKKVVDS